MLKVTYDSRLTNVTKLLSKNCEVSNLLQRGLLEALSSVFQLTNIQIPNPFQVKVPVLYLLKASENQRGSYIFRMYRNGTLT